MAIEKIIEVHLIASYLAVFKFIKCVTGHAF
ncbi:MAG: hypothetical protein Hyperionvirus4_123 [Hyperionvirus sp.]|uniref:Uncharacterized protein n=1 Tax=Hyperionvirus sp. TaxID=2487770 RepID=A0A3G5A7K6_9VIRU|nr:MAG: hypothetical protein Hyperionvirus4_123 [Hyperionvirus sp.]